GLGGDDGLRLGDVRELQLGGDVTDGVDAGDVGAQALVDRDGAAVGQLDTGGLEAVALHARSEADGLQHLVDGDDLDLAGLVVLDLDGDGGTVVGDLLDGGTGLDGDAQLLVRLGDLLGDVGVL